jgi:hypothetical protein
MVVGFQCRNKPGDGDAYDAPHNLRLKAISTITTTPTARCLTHDSPCTASDIHGKLISKTPHDALARAEADRTDIDKMCALPSVSYWATFCTGWNYAHEVAEYEPFILADYTGTGARCVYAEIRCRWETVYEFYSNMEISVPKSEGYRLVFTPGGQGAQDRETTCLDASDNTYWRMDCTIQRDQLVPGWTQPDGHVLPGPLDGLVNRVEPEPARSPDAQLENECNQKGAPC